MPRKLKSDNNEIPDPTLIETNFIRLGVLLERNRARTDEEVAANEIRHLFPSLLPASEVTKEESVADIKAASKRVEVAFAELNKLIAREQERGALESVRAAQ
jgi:hypothetical protein